MSGCGYNLCFAVEPPRRLFWQNNRFPNVWSCTLLFFLSGAYIFLFTSIFAIDDALNGYRLTYVWTYAVSISLIYFLYFYFPGH